MRIKTNIDDALLQNILILIISSFLITFGLFLNLYFFRNVGTGDLIKNYAQIGAPPIEEMIKIGFAGLFSSLIFTFNRNIRLLRIELFSIVLIIIAIVFGISEVLDGKIEWNIIDHIGYSSLFALVFFHYFSPDMRGQIVSAIRGFFSAWILHFFHNVLVLLYKGTEFEIMVAGLFWFISPIIIYSCIIRIYFNLWPPWRIREMKINDIISTWIHKKYASWLEIKDTDHRLIRDFKEVYLKKNIRQFYKAILIIFVSVLYGFYFNWDSILQYVLLIPIMILIIWIAILFVKDGGDNYRINQLIYQISESNLWPLSNGTIDNENENSDRQTNS